ncbi:hypothetical protein AAC387_Pa07g2972 [Persea americana]
MRTEDQEKYLRGMNFAGSSHGDQNVEEERSSLPQNTDDSSSWFNVSDSCDYGSVAQVVKDTLALGEKLRNSLLQLLPSLSSSHVTAAPHSSPAGGNKFFDPSAAPRKSDPMLLDQPNSFSKSKDITKMEIDILDSDVRAMDADEEKNVQAMESDKSLHESSVEVIHECGGQICDDNSGTCGKASKYIPVVIIDSDDDDEEDKAMYKCSDQIGGNDSEICGDAPDSMRVVITIGSSDDEDENPVNARGASTPVLEPCNAEKHLGDKNQIVVDAVLREPSMYSPHAQHVSCQERYDEVKNTDLDNSVLISVTEETCADNAKVIIHPPCALLISSCEKIETQETNQQTSKQYYTEDDLTFTEEKSVQNLPSDKRCTCEVNMEGGEGESVMELQTYKCCASERDMEEDEKYDVGESVTELQTGKHCTSEGNMVGESGMELQTGKCHASVDNIKESEKNNVDESIMELEHGVKTGLNEDTRMNSYTGMATECLTLESHHMDGLENDSLTDIWREMAMALEYSKTAASDSSVVQHRLVEECKHSCVLKEDLGYVCRICGVIEKSIDTIFDFQWIKGTRTTRTYMSDDRTTKPADSTEVTDFSGHVKFEHDLSSAKMSVHPRHMMHMRPHQLEGFNFLLRNLVTDKPGGCILAHAPGSGKTFMIISFIQSFLAKYPFARPLIVLPKGIIPTWKKEFQRWQVEDIPLHDFYASKAGNRGQQLDVLKSWIEQKSILFLGYKQLSSIICDSANNKIAAACRERILKAPGLLILDEGHTPRNKYTDVFQSLRKVQTPRKIVLSGTLFQNHVSEVFNILDLVRPKFLELDSSRAIVKRILSRVPIMRSRRQFKTNSEATVFCDSVEEALRNGDDLKRKVTLINDLREMTNDVLHYYEGDFLEELPGLVDFTVFLHLRSMQKDTIQTLKRLEKFKRASIENSVYVHPHLKEISENTMGDRGDIFDQDKIDRLLDKIDVKDGVKTKFFLNILGLSESSGEKLLVFSMYLLPLKFLERLLVKEKGWSPGKEIFLISGDSSTEQREWSTKQFNCSPDSKVLFGSIKACGEGISLVGASRVLILDVHLNPSVTRQAIGRAFRPGQMKKVYTYRLVAADSLEEEDHYASLRKELVSKMWFEWSRFCNHQDYEMDEIDLKNCDDMFLESAVVRQDVKFVYKRLAFKSSMNLNSFLLLLNMKSILFVQVNPTMSDKRCTCEVNMEGGEGKSVMKLQTDKCCTSERNMKEDEKYDVGESVMELQTGKCCTSEGNMVGESGMKLQTGKCYTATV